MNEEALEFLKVEFSAPEHFDATFSCFANAVQPDELFSLDLDKVYANQEETHLWESWFHNPAFLEYIEARHRKPKCPGMVQKGLAGVSKDQRFACTENNPCIGNMSDAHHRQHVAKQFAAWSRHHYRDGRLACQSCNVHLTPYDVNVLPNEQKITALQIQWIWPDSCHGVYNVKALLCAGCHFILQLCNGNPERFYTVQKHLFRWQQQLGPSTLANNPLPYENRIDNIDKVSSVKKEVYGSLPLLRSTWACQRGLVCYPLTNWDEIRWKHELAHISHLVCPGEYMEKALSEQKKAHYNLAQVEWTPNVQVMAAPSTKQDNNNNPQKKRKRLMEDQAVKQELQKRQHQVSNCCWLQLWIPIDPSPSSKSFFSRWPVARDRSRPCGPDNYLISIELLHSLELRFEYADFIQWLARTCYWDFSKSEIADKFDAFRLIRFKAFDWTQDEMTRTRWLTMHSSASYPWLIKPESQSSKRFLMPCIRYDTNEEKELSIIREYVNLELRKVFSLQTKDLEPYIQAARNIMTFLSLQHQRLELQQNCNDYYNREIFQLEQELSDLKLNQENADRDIRPIVATLQRFKVDLETLGSVGLSLEKSVKFKSVSKFSELEQEEQVDFFRSHYAPLSTEDPRLVHLIVNDLKDKAFVDKILGKDKAHSYRLTISHPLYKKQKTSGPKRLTIKTPQSSARLKAVAAKKEKLLVKKEKISHLPAELWLGNALGDI